MRLYVKRGMWKEARWRTEPVFFDWQEAGNENEKAVCRQKGIFMCVLRIERLNWRKETREPRGEKLVRFVSGSCDGRVSCVPDSVQSVYDSGTTSTLLKRCLRRLFSLALSVTSVPSSYFLAFIFLSQYLSFCLPTIGFIKTSRAVVLCHDSISFM